MDKQISITLPDGAEVRVPAGTTPLEVAAKISGRLAREAVAAKADGAPIDLSRPLNDDVSLKIITSADGEEALEVLRHSTSHIMAQAVKQLWPGTQVAIGPAIENGFYYDFLKDEAFTEEDLAEIEARMRELAAQDLEIRRVEMPKAEAVALFRGKGESFKAELVEERVETETATLYEQGDFIDLCRGPHLPSTGGLKAFKLLSVAGAYWKGDESNVQLQRIYGTSFFKQKDLEDYLALLEEAKRRDHRKLGRELDLFSFQEEVGGGLVFWHPKGALIRQIIEDYLRAKLIGRGYQLVVTPHIARGRLWELTGHLSYYRENMYLMEVDGAPYVVKPMNCPGHIVIYKDRRRSYRELPIRYAEFGTVYRREREGVLHGLLRVRGFTQDDAHIFCTPEQIVDEIEELLNFSFDIYKDFGFEDYEVNLSVRDPKREDKYAGSAEGWELAEKSLVQALGNQGIPYTRLEGEAVFYGPKIDIKLKDSLGRGWQATTIQFDFNLPERLNVTYIGEDGAEHQALMVHRALFGSLERFFGILIEHYAGAFPVWQAPVQAVVLPITDTQHSYAREVARKLLGEELRVAVDERNEKIGYKIREHQLQKVPFMLVCGEREEKDGTVSVRNRFEGDQGSAGLEAFIDRVKGLIRSKAVRP
jgi:threonyl-tRNA synthetase